MARDDFTADEEKIGRMLSGAHGALQPTGASDLLGELLDSVRAALGVDIAFVLLLDPPSGQLIVTAGKGAGVDILQGLGVPLGRGVAGRVAFTRRPMLIENVVRGDVVHSRLYELGIRSLLGVPLAIGESVMGVLDVGTFTSRRYTGGEVEFLEDSADRAALALQALMARSEHQAAKDLQRSLLPETLPALPGVELAARYSAGTADVGGDWYDAFTLPSGELCLVIGDVAGHGLHAATVMGRMRSALRAYALQSADPADVLTRLNVMVEHFEPEATATVLYGVWDLSLDHVTMSSAGHWPPVLASPGRSPTLLDIDPDPLIGWDGATTRKSATVPIPPDSLLGLFTDGLVERRDQSIDAGLAQLCQSVFLGHPDAVCAAVMASFLRREPLEDDAALFMVRRNARVPLG
jgi:phosphoserine phosphatase RsbU/P